MRPRAPGKRRDVLSISAEPIERPRPNWPPTTTASTTGGGERTHGCIKGFTSGQYQSAAQHTHDHCKAIALARCAQLQQEPLMQASCISDALRCDEGDGGGVAAATGAAAERRKQSLPPPGRLRLQAARLESIDAGRIRLDSRPSERRRGGRIFHRQWRHQRTNELLDAEDRRINRPTLHGSCFGRTPVFYDRCAVRLDHRRNQANGSINCFYQCIDRQDAAFSGR
jgi:hypothetical protein